jgi:hypothetical protein
VLIGARDRSRAQIRPTLPDAGACYGAAVSDPLAPSRKQALAEFLSDWQARHGKVTAAELAKARTELGHAGVKRRRLEVVRRGRDPVKR